MNEVEVPYGDNASETATLLLAAAEELGYQPWQVRTTSDNTVFLVPEEVAEKVESDKKSDEKAAAKKTAAKKAPAKKAASK